MPDSPPARPTRELLRKIVALADDERGDVAVRKNARRKLRAYAAHYPDLLRVKADEKSQS